MFSGCSTYLHDIEGIYLQHYATTQSGFAEVTAFDRAYTTVNRGDCGVL
jgi:hypothetical protein